MSIFYTKRSALAHDPPHRRQHDGTFTHPFSYSRTENGLNYSSRATRAFISAKLYRPKIWNGPAEGARLSVAVRSAPVILLLQILSTARHGRLGSARLARTAGARRWLRSRAEQQSAEASASHYGRTEHSSEHGKGVGVGQPGVWAPPIVLFLIQILPFQRPDLDADLLETMSCTPCPNFRHYLEVKVPENAFFRTKEVLIDQEPRHPKRVETSVPIGWAV